MKKALVHFAWRSCFTSSMKLLHILNEAPARFAWSSCTFWNECMGQEGIQTYTSVYLLSAYKLASLHSGWWRPLLFWFHGAQFTAFQQYLVEQLCLLHGQSSLWSHYPFAVGREFQSHILSCEPNAAVAQCLQDLWSCGDWKICHQNGVLNLEPVCWCSACYSSLISVKTLVTFEYFHQLLNFF